MPDLKISQLTPAISLTGNELMPLAISGTNESATTAQVAGLATSSLTDKAIPYNNAGVLADSYLVNDIDILKSVYGGSDIGLLLDFANGQYFLGNPSQGANVKSVDSTNQLSLGDYDGNINGVYLNIDNSAEIIVANHYTNPKGLKLDFGYNKYSLGDFDIINAGTYLQVDNGNQIIQTFNDATAAGAAGLKLDFGNNYFVFGRADEGYIQTGANYVSIVSAPNGDSSFNCQFYNVQIGDFTGAVNNTNITVDDADQIISFLNTAGKYNFYSVPVYASNAAAITGGLIAGDIYRITGSDHLGIVH